MVSINVTNQFENITGIKDILLIPNANTGGWFWLGMLGMIWVVFLITFLSYSIEIALLSSSFIAVVIGIFMVYLGLISWQWLMFFFGIILAVLFYTTWQNKKDVF